MFWLWIGLAFSAGSLFGFTMAALFCAGAILRGRIEMSSPKETLNDTP